MPSVDLHILVQGLINFLSPKSFIMFIGLIIFLIWTGAELLPAIEHIMLSMRTTDFQNLSGDVNKHVSDTLVPFGEVCSKLLIITIYGFIVCNVAEWAYDLPYDWDRNIKALKRERKKMRKRLESDIAIIEQLSKDAHRISRTAKDFEIVADKIKFLKLELDAPRKPKPGQKQHDTPKTAELFSPIVKASNNPPKIKQSERPEF